jgi:hypothetical protein
MRPVTTSTDGRPKKVDVYGPGDWDDPRPGVEYQFTWHGHTSVYIGEGEPPRHEYLSTACWHATYDGKPELHAGCRNSCKHAPEGEVEPCVCPCHGEAGTQPGRVSWVDQARDVARELLAEIDNLAVDVGPLAERIRTDPALFWLRGEEQPPGEWTGSSAD